MITRRKSDYPAAILSCTSTLSAFAIYAIIWCGVAIALPPQNNAGPSTTAQQQEVVISASKLVDQDTLKHVVLPRFVKSHGTPSERLGQVGRWYEKVCPETVGLRSVYNEFISNRVIEVARKVGAPTQRAGKCTRNIKIIFSAHPQAQVDFIASKYRVFLGYSSHPDELHML